MPDAEPIYALNGPALNRLRARAAHVDNRVPAPAPAAGRAAPLVDCLQEGRDKADAIVLNAAAYIHTSVAPYEGPFHVSFASNAAPDGSAALPAQQHESPSA